jgi:alkylated DNA repair dioxygenase AlkB
MDDNSKPITLLRSASSKLVLYKSYFDLDLDQVQSLELVERPPIIIYGKECRQNRNVGFFSNESTGYNYSSQQAPSSPMPKWLKQLTEKINIDLNTDFNGVLVNQYTNGTQSIGSHSDDERTLSQGPNGLCVAALSYGATRKFRIRARQETQVFVQPDIVHKTEVETKPTNRGNLTWVAKENSIIADVPHMAGDLLVMIGDFQREFRHEIPVEKKVSEPRWSLTFRTHSQ